MLFGPPLYRFISNSLFFEFFLLLFLDDLMLFSQFIIKGLEMMLGIRRSVFFLILLSSQFVFGEVEFVLKEKVTSFSALRGKWVFINYWAPWCDACLQEIRTFNQFYQQNRDRVALFSVNFDNPKEALHRDFYARFKMEYPALIKDPGPSLGLNDVSVVPATFVYTPEGRFYKVLYGAQRRSSLERIIRK